MNKYEIKRSAKLRKLAAQVIKERPDLHWIREAGVKLCFLESQQEKKTGNNTKLVLGECTKVKETMHWCCPYHFLITVYVQNCIDFNDEKLKILLWHELKHVGMKQDTVEPEFYVVPHDYEEFADIIKEYGLDWA